MHSVNNDKTPEKKDYKFIIITFVLVLIVAIVVFVALNGIVNTDENVHIMAPTQDYNSSEYLEQEKIKI